MKIILFVYLVKMENFLQKVQANVKNALKELIQHLIMINVLLALQDIFLKKVLLHVIFVQMEHIL